MKTTLAKFNLNAVKKEDGSMEINGHAVTTGCEENKSFAKYTPGGSLSLSISEGTPAIENFEEGNHEYYVEIRKVEKAADAVEASTDETAE